MKDCDPSEVPQVKTRFFGTWCQEFYSIAFQYAVEQAKKAAESMFMVQEMQIGESSAQIDSVREQEKLKEELQDTLVPNCFVHGCYKKETCIGFPCL